ncbi:MAG: nucleoside/nucleotide kinase family protein [Planctomycetota bacterium]
MFDAEPMVLTDDAIERAARACLSTATDPQQRWMLGIAGIAASGKSTLAERLVAAANAHQPGSAAFIPMDGFHLSNAQLIEQGWKQRKGAPFTYDAEAYVDVLRRFREAAAVGGYPVYCRKAHEPVSSAQPITHDVRLIVTEGQYLLSPEPPWSALGEVLDECWWLDVTPDQARKWLMKRDTAVGRSVEEAEAKYQRNDRLNIEFVLTGRREPDRIVRWPRSE